MVNGLRLVGVEMAPAASQLADAEASAAWVLKVMDGLNPGPSPIPEPSVAGEPGFRRRFGPSLPPRPHTPAGSQARPFIPGSPLDLASGRCPAPAAIFPWPPSRTSRMPPPSPRRLSPDLTLFKLAAAQVLMKSDGDGTPDAPPSTGGRAESGRRSGGTGHLGSGNPGGQANGTDRGTAPDRSPDLGGKPVPPQANGEGGSGSPGCEQAAPSPACSSKSSATSPRALAAGSGLRAAISANLVNIPKLGFMGVFADHRLSGPGALLPVEGRRRFEHGRVRRQAVLPGTGRQDPE